MKKIIFILIFGVFSFFIIFYFKGLPKKTEYGAPPYSSEDDPDPSGFTGFFDFTNWKRPDGPLRVGLQAGHWKNAELPDELERIRGNGGASSRGTAEWEVNLEIAKKTAEILQKEGIVVDILPATIPESYWADVFVSIHADGSTSSSTAGFKVAAPRRDYTGKAKDLVAIIEEDYLQEVGFPIDPNVTRNMRGYYAFSWWRYKHAVHPMTPSVILETGFMTNPKEASLLINSPEIPARALANSILKFLKP